MYSSFLYFIFFRKVPLSSLVLCASFEAGAEERKLGEITKTEIRAHLKKYWNRQGNCPVCGCNEWEVLDGEFVIKAAQGEGQLPITVVHCGKCGNIIFLAADVIRKEVRQLISPPA